MVTSIKDTMYPVIGDLVGNIRAAITKYASRHVQLYVRTDIFPNKRASCKLIAGLNRAVLIAEVLQVTFPGLVAHGAIQGVIDE